MTTRTKSTDSLASRLARKSAANAATGCIEWTGKLSRQGYGEFRITRRGPPRRVHRLAWEVKYGSIPPGLMVLHGCDNKRCINTAHLRLGTNMDNVRDAMDRNRYPDRRGSLNQAARLNEVAVRVIRFLYARGDFPQTALADAYGVSNRTVSILCQRKTWKHVA